MFNGGPEAAPGPSGGSPGEAAYVYTLRGIEVQFPFEAYECQLEYMEKVLESLQGGGNALLESPTGTGKTMCLLCATLAWQDSIRQAHKKLRAEGHGGALAGTAATGAAAGQQLVEPATIVYTSRTHSQLKKVMDELRHSPYRPRATILGSRRQMCVHKEVAKLAGHVQVTQCKGLVRRRACAAHQQLDPWLKRNENAAQQAYDIEDLVGLVEKERGGCPYYLTKELSREADIVLLPYNYFISPEMRRGLNVNWDKAVLIVDEAHNIEGVCSDAGSASLSGTHLGGCTQELSYARDYLLQQVDAGNADLKEDAENFYVAKGIIGKLQEQLVAVAKQMRKPEDGRTEPGEYVVEFLERVGISLGTMNQFINLLRTAENTLQEHHMAPGGSGRRDGNSRIAVLREFLENVLSVVAAGGGAAAGDLDDDPLDPLAGQGRAPGRLRELFEGYRAHVNFESGYGGKQANPAAAVPVLNLWSFKPGRAMRALGKLRLGSILLTSGTLSPMDSFAHELEIDFPVRLENPHVIDPSQVWVGALPKGPAGEGLNSSYKNRQNARYYQDLGNAIANFAQVVPDGLLVFFPSFAVMNASIGAWRKQQLSGPASVWDRIQRVKHTVIEPRSTAQFAEVARDFDRKLNDKSKGGAVFFAVCRGKVSEGLDFSDRAGRAVVITGIPYPMAFDPKVRLKKQILDQAYQKDRRGLQGQEWYTQQATRAVNQAIGRVIRHSKDFGAILLCDDRFLGRAAEQGLSSWVRPRLEKFNQFGAGYASLTAFFKAQRGNLGHVNDKRKLARRPAPDREPPRRKAFRPATGAGRGPGADAGLQELVGRLKADPPPGAREERDGRAAADRDRPRDLLSVSLTQSQARDPPPRWQPPAQEATGPSGKSASLFDRLRAQPAAKVATTARPAHGHGPGRAPGGGGRGAPRQAKENPPRAGSGPGSGPAKPPNALRDFVKKWLKGVRKVLPEADFKRLMQALKDIMRRDEKICMQTLDTVFEVFTADQRHTGFLRVFGENILESLPKAQAEFRKRFALREQRLNR